jgi:hypothetical protein
MVGRPTLCGRLCSSSTLARVRLVVLDALDKLIIARLEAENLRPCENRTKRVLVDLLMLPSLARLRNLHPSGP